MTEPIRPDLEAPPLLEQLGALSSLLMHDLANQLCIISGSASFSQLVIEEPERVTASLDTILQAGQTAGYFIERCGEWRRGLATALPPSRAQAVVETLRAFTAVHTTWTLEAANELPGSVRLPAPWVVFALQNLIAEVRADRGVIRVSSPAAAEPSTPAGVPAAAGASGRTPTLRITLIYAGEVPLSLKDVRARYENLGLLAAFELNRSLGGQLGSRTVGPGLQEVWLELAGAGY
jgi:hypothetical protein